MAGRAETTAVYAAGAAQGIVLVTFPSASTIFTDPTEYDLSSSQYGTIFLPQVVTAVTAALLGARLGRRVGTKRVYLVGLACGTVAMALLVLSQFFTSEQSVAYGLLLLAAASLGAGFGLTVPALNTLTASFHPQAVDSSVLVLNALLGLGTAMAPVFVAVFVGLGFWWGLPVMSAILLATLFAVSLRLPLRTGGREAGGDISGVNDGGDRARVPARFWVYAAFAMLYGMSETVNGNWAQLDMTGDLGATTTLAALALTAFWAMVTAGRVLFAAVERAFPARWAYRLLPFLLGGSFVFIALLPADAPALGVLAFGLAGVGCSALLPLTISFGQEELAAVAATVSGGVIAFYQVGYGIAAFGVGPLRTSGVSLPTIYGFSALIAVVMGVLSFVVTRARPSPAAAHARPEPATATPMR